MSHLNGAAARPGSPMFRVGPTRNLGSAARTLHLDRSAGIDRPCACLAAAEDAPAVRFSDDQMVRPTQMERSACSGEGKRVIQMLWATVSSF